MNSEVGEKVFASGSVTVTGTVYWDETRQRVGGAVIKAISGDRKEAALVALADDDGDFTLTGLSAGKWTFIVFDEEGHVSRKHEIDLTSDQPAVTCDLSIPRRMDERDRRAGQWFLTGLCLGLAALIALYIGLHAVFPQKQVAPWSSAVGFFWTEEPWRFLEVLFWALAGILTNLIIMSGSYLRWERFYHQGIPMHISHIVTVPLLTLVLVFILSLLTVKITLTGGNEVQLDLSDPRVLVAISFLVSSRPWGLWRFIQQTSERITA